MSLSHHVNDITDLETKLKDAGEHLVVIDFFATWCGPCKLIAPKFEELAAAHPDVVFLKVDVDECEEVAEKYAIQSMPTFLFIKNSQMVEKFSGASESKLEQMIVKLK